jgi:hypothetical protein
MTAYSTGYRGIDPFPVLGSPVLSTESVGLSNDPSMLKGLNPELRKMLSSTPMGIRLQIESWKNERENLAENNPMHSFVIQNEDAYKILGYAVNPFGSEGLATTAVVDDLVFPYKEYAYDKQIIMPFAPQKPQAFYKPKYEKLTEQQKEQLDEAITRYWCPGITLKPDDRFVFKFPTAAGGENYNYMLIIEGITNKGEPIHITKKLVF